ncbi:cytochrome c oxidase subunit 3 family protein [Pseudonocardia sp. EV170527-09]|uniref:cytochrome c oxidase subunit 3 n=1 Tax=Pseudonocardia sp. EV170527-09 TaxID=2603411 RepID=UPI0011F3C52A|nr:cytochrome c oxidase subunit 3 [Pseudonocardia sp. EV170527-09]KAA1030439.1 cytochrome c oxidase subunit 3 family protein [Pseudonocardia sp. EV170527-09]
MTETSASPSPAAAPIADRGRHVPGEPGLWILVLGDMTVFAVFFATYLVVRGGDPAGFDAAQARLDPVPGVVNTLVLLLSSLLVVRAVQAVRMGAARRATVLLGGAIACGVTFSVIKAFEWGAKFGAGITPNTHEFFMYFFVLTGLHWLHVLAGLVALVLMTAACRRPDRLPGRLPLIEGAACFWHMVDLLWIVLFPLLYLVR